MDSNIQNTNKVKENPLNPTWKKTFKFNVFNPENAVLLFLLYYEYDSFTGLLAGTTKMKAAYYSLPVSCVRQGYRFVGLKNPDGSPSPLSNLFCNISIKHLDSHHIFNNKLTKV